jgi:mRNA (guanine-N7-)-methyltransferase
MSQRRVTSHYDEKHQKPKAAFYTSPIVVLKKLNNWIKSVLIQKYTKVGAAVLDLGCGKGGDLPKWKHAQVGRLVLSDVSEKQLERAKSRFSTCQTLTIETLQGDFTSPKFAPDPQAFDIVSCQFAFHYAFRSEKQLIQTLSMVSGALKVGGLFILTVPDGKRIQEELLKPQGTDTCRLTYTGPLPDFGASYQFYLKDAIDCEEFLVKDAVLQKHCIQVGLTVVETERFDNAFFQWREKPEAQAIAKRMQLSLSSADVPLQQWDVFKLYRFYVFWRTPIGK